jgi:hypothetical protein
LKGWSLSLIATSVALRIALIFRYRFDSDEPQHMHVAWGWAHGFAQYRDVFDNHMPLFHLLSAPLFAFAGDDPRLLFAARLAMVPLFLATLAMVWLIARRLFDETIAWWSAAVAALIPPFFLGSLEYRTDDLWVAIWVAIVAVAVSALPLKRRALYGGLLLGSAFAVSMKSTLFGIAIIGALLATFLLTLKRGALPAWRDVARATLLVIAGAVVIPAMICTAIAVTGLWDSFVYGAFIHNKFPWEHKYKVLWFIPLYFIVRAVALRLARAEGETAIVRMRLFVAMAAGVYLTVVVAFWPMTALESYLPFYPLAALMVAPLLLRRRLLVPAFAVAMIAAIVVTAAPWKNEAHQEIAMIDEVLALTDPGDPVMDLKGESVFRERPYYFVLEAITNIKLRVGILRDQIADTLVRSATHVVVSDNLPPHAREFVRRNYVRWGAVNVAGVLLPPLSAVSPVDFDLAIPGSYVVMSERGLLNATIDGKQVGHNGVPLAPGRHRLLSTVRASRAMVLWSGALRGRRFTPCESCDRDHAEPFLVAR